MKMIVSFIAVVLAVSLTAGCGARTEKLPSPTEASARDTRSPASLDMKKAEMEVETHYAKANPEIQEYVLWTARAFGRSGMWLNEDAYDALPADAREEKIKRLASLLEESEYGRHLCAGLTEAGALKDKRLLPGLMKVAGYHRDDRDYDCRPKWMAVAALARQESAEAVPLLISLVDHGNQNTRNWARAALSRKTGQDFKQDKQAWADWWRTQGNEPIEEKLLKPWTPAGAPLAPSPTVPIGGVGSLRPLRPDGLEFVNREVGTMKMPRTCTIHGKVEYATPDVSSENLARLDSAESLGEVGDILKRILGNGPAPGVVVVLRSGTITRETTTDSEGGFTFPDVSAEACELSVKGELAAPPSWEGDSHVATVRMAMSRDEVKSGFPVTLELRADHITVSGRITNAARQPLAGVKVTGVSVFKSIDQYSWVESGRYSTMSDANGYYEFGGLTPENVYAIAGAGDFSGLMSLEIRTEVDGFRPGIVRVPLVSEDLLKPAQRLTKSLEPLYLKWGEGKGKSLPKSKRPELDLPSSKGSRITGIDIVLDPA